MTSSTLISTISTFLITSSTLLTHHRRHVLVIVRGVTYDSSNINHLILALPSAALSPTTSSPPPQPSSPLLMPSSTLLMPSSTLLMPSSTLIIAISPLLVASLTLPITFSHVIESLFWLVYEA